MIRQWCSRHVGGSVETNVEKRVEARVPGEAGLRLQMLGPLMVFRGAAAIALPRSRKVRALLGYLALTRRKVTRSQLCELLWDAPSDPRGELRWSLSRLRRIVNDSHRRRVEAHGEFIALDLSDCRVDALELVRAIKPGIDPGIDLGIDERDRLRALAQNFGGEFLEGLHIDDSPLFTQWLGAERRQLRAAQAAVLGMIVHRDPDADDVLSYLEQWLKVDPFARNAHESLLSALVRRGRLREAEEHLAATMHLFELEGLDWLSIREAWRAAKNRERTAMLRVDATAVDAPGIDMLVTPAQSMAHRASICVMPFLEDTAGGEIRSDLGEGLADDIITRLAKLRVLFVIARGTAFALGARHLEPEEAARVLNVDYVVSGILRRRGRRITLRIELAEARQPRIVWADEFECTQDTALYNIDEVGNGIVTAIAEEVEAAERNRAILKPPNSLDAWEAYHRGLWHIYRFNRADNDRAEHFFRLSANLDPTFARAQAGLSFAHFQNAFLHRPTERALHIDRAFEAAGHSLMADDRDPAAHWAMGRALWLRGGEAESLIELHRSVDLSPSFALGHYTMGFVQSQSGDVCAAIGSVDLSQRLSPFDPLLFAMLACRALAHVRLGEFETAAGWAQKAAARPNAHAHILAIAACCLAAADRVEDARAYAARIHADLPSYGLADFLGGFHFAPEAQALFRRVAGRAGLA